MKKTTLRTFEQQKKQQQKKQNKNWKLQRKIKKGEF